jgi:hypothetical protein
MPPGDGLAGEVDHPLGRRLRRGVGGVEVQGAGHGRVLAGIGRQVGELPPDRPGGPASHDLGDPALRAAEVPQQLADVPVRAAGTCAVRSAPVIAEVSRPVWVTISSQYRS